jgi:hypothetical protein
MASTQTWRVGCLNVQANDQMNGPGSEPCRGARGLAGRRSRLFRHSAQFFPGEAHNFSYRMSVDEIFKMQSPKFERLKDVKTKM